MKSSTTRRLVLIALFLALTFAAIALIAQEAPPAQSQAQVEPASHPTEAAQHAKTETESSGDPNSGVSVILSEATEKAAHSSEVWGKMFGLSHDTSYWLSLLLNFGGIALLFYFLLKSKLPQMLRDRTKAIQQGIREAQAASADATQRLNSIEARLAKIDSEIAAIRGESDQQAVAEEQRIRAAAEEDKQKVVDSAKAEIDSIARTARRDLKSYAASLAIDIASKRIHVDERSDQALVREFVDQLGKDGQ